MSKLRYEEFKHAIDLDAFEDAIGFEVMRHDRGNDVGRCVFPDNHSHGDTTGKFAIHRDKLIYNCWVCEGGSLLSLVMELYDFDVDEATVWLYQFAHEDTARTEGAWTVHLLELLKDVEQRTETMPYFNERVLTRFDGPIDYFRGRGISDEIIEQYQLRFGQTVMRSAPIKHTDEGPVKKGKDYFGPAAIFPHFWQGVLVGWQYRWLDWDEEHSNTPRWLPKYTNTTSFPKETTLFNYDRALQSHNPIVVLESAASALFVMSYGYPAVAYFGSKPTSQQLRLLRRFRQGVILAPDNDKIGDTLVRTAAAYLQDYIPVNEAERVDLGPKADLGDYAKTSDPAGNLHEHLTRRIREVGLSL